MLLTNILTLSVIIIWAFKRSYVREERSANSKPQQLLGTGIAAQFKCISSYRGFRMTVLIKCLP